MAWGDAKGRNEYLTLGPYRMPHERDADCNKLCAADGRWHMHSTDICRKTGGYIAIMCRWIEEMESA